MTATPHGAEADLCRVYREQAIRYEEVLRLADQLPAALRESGGADGALQRIAGLLSEVRGIDDAVSAARHAWRAEKRQPGPELAAELARLTGLIERLAARVDEAQREAGAQRDRLTPELEGIARSRQMQRAYSTTP